MRPDRPMGMGGGDWSDPTGAAGAAAAFGFPGAAAMARMQGMQGMQGMAGLPAPHVNPAFFAGQLAQQSMGNSE